MLTELRLFSEYRVSKILQTQIRLYGCSARLKFIGFEINDVGKAKKPMKELCKNLLEKDLIRRGMPDQSFSSPVYYRMLLNQLYRGGDKKTYNNQLKKIANNIVYRVSITSKVSTSLEKMDYDMFNVSCYKLSSKDKIIYRKWSFASKE